MTLGVVSALEAYAFPTIYKVAPDATGVVPIPIFDTEMRVSVFVVPETFTFVVKMFEVTRALGR